LKNCGIETKKHSAAALTKALSYFVIQELKKQERKNESSLFARGELSEERQQQFEKQFLAYEKLLTSTQSVSDALDMEMPVLEDEKEVLIGIVETSGGAEDKGLASSVFEDEDSVMFYEQILDLRTLVPKIFLETTKSKKDKKDDAAEAEKESEKTSKGEQGAGTDADGTTKEGDDAMDELDENADFLKDDLGAELEELDLNDNTGTEVFLAEETTSALQEPVTTASKTTATQLDAFLAKLPNMCNRDVIDQAAVEFCYMNSKLSRNRLIKVGDLPWKFREALDYRPRTQDCF